MDNGIKAFFESVQAVLTGELRGEDNKSMETRALFLYWDYEKTISDVYVGSFAAYLNKSENDDKRYSYDMDKDSFDIRDNIYNLFLDCVRNYDPASGEFENYFNKVWSFRKKDYAKSYKNYYNSVRLEQPIEGGSDSKVQLTVGSIVPDGKMNTAKTAENRMFISQLYLDVGSNISSLLDMKKDDKKAKHFVCFYSEDVIKVAKNIEKIDNSKRIYRSTQQGFVNHCMSEKCNCMQDVRETPLKKRGDFGILQSPDEELPWEIVEKRKKDGTVSFSMKKFPTKVYFDYFGEKNENSFNATVSTERKEYERLYWDSSIEIC